jgi:excisionase family DNA binding protein
VTPASSTGLASPLATVQQAVAFANVSRSTIYALMDTGKLANVRIGGARRIPWSALRELVEKGA